MKCWTDLADSMEDYVGKLRRRLAALEGEAGIDNTTEDEDGDEGEEGEERETEDRYNERRQRMRRRRNIHRDTVSYLMHIMYMYITDCITADMLTGQDFKERLQSLQVCLYSTASCPGKASQLCGGILYCEISCVCVYRQ